MAKLLIPALVAGAAAIGFVAYTHQRHEKEIQKIHSVPIRPPSAEEVAHKMRFEVENYIHQSALDPYDVARKRRFIHQSAHDHCMRQFPHLYHRGVSHHEMRIRAIGIAEKVCHQLHIHLKPRCRYMDVYPRGVGRIGGISHIPHKKAYAVNIYELDYNHAPTPTQRGGLY